MKLGYLMGFLLCLAVAVASPRIAHEIMSPTSTVTYEVVEPVQVPESRPQVYDAVKEINVQPVQKVITLQDRNVIVFRGPVTGDSVASAMQEALKKSRALKDSEKIYLVLDTPGGSVFDGLDFMDFLKGLPQEVDTITLFAASMGFQFAQQLETRYIINNGTLMSHRGFLGGLKGQLDGEFETRYAMIKRKIDYMDVIAAKRMGLSLKDYKKLILNEYWVHGFDAISDKAADESVLVKCGKTMDGSYKETFNTLFGPVEVTFAKCPLIKSPLEVSFKGIATENQAYVRHAFKNMFLDKKAFVQEFITTNKLNTIFPE